MSARDNPITFAMISLFVGIAVVVFVVMIVGLAGFSFGSGEPTAQENAARMFPGSFDDLVPRGHRITLVHGEVPPAFAGSATKWFEISVWPEDVPGIEQILGRKLRSVSAMPKTLPSAPAWWHPESLADGQIFWRERGTNSFYVTSCSTGTIYYYFQGH